MQSFIDPAQAEDRNVFCGYCAEPVKGHLAGCPHCQRRFFPNKHGYARLCKNPNCRRTETAGHAHGLCRMHHESRKARQAASALQPNCRCGGKASFGEIDCRRCREQREFQQSRYIKSLGAQEGYSMYGQRVVNTEEVNGIPAGAHGRITWVEPGKLGSSWRYAFMADNWGETQHPFTLLTADQFTMEDEQ